MVDPVWIACCLIGMKPPSFFLIFGYCLSNVPMMVYLYTNIFKVEIFQEQFTYRVFKEIRIKGLSATTEAELSKKKS